MQGSDAAALWRRNLAILKRYRWVVLAGISVGAAVALIASFLSTPLYKATASVHVERQTPDVLTFRDLSRIDYSWAAYSDFYETQYEILDSEAVASRVVERLGLVEHPAFAPEGRRGLLSRLRALWPGRSSAPDGTADPAEVATARVRSGLAIDPLHNSQLIRVSWISPDPELAATIANAVTDAYAQYHLESRFTTSDQAVEFLVDQIDALRDEIAELEVRLQEYGESKRIVSIDDSSNITYRALSDIAVRETEARTRLAAAEAAYRAIADASPEALPDVRNSTLITRLKEEYAALEAQHSEQSRRFKDGWPGMRTLDSKLAQARERLDLEIQRVSDQVRLAAETEYRKAAAEVDNLRRLLAEQEGAAQGLKRDAILYADLHDEVDKKRETLNALIARQGEMALTTQLRDVDAASSNIRVVDRAKVPPAPFRPRTARNVLLGALAGLFLGVGLAVLSEQIDGSVASLEQLAEATSLPLLAVVPRHGENEPALSRLRRRRAVETGDPIDLVVHRIGRSRVAEAYRELRTAVLLSGAGRQPRRIMVTSSLPGEGKSSSAINMAVALAHLGRRVLLVDGDLRKPRLHQPLEVDNVRGLSTFLSGMEDALDRLVVATGIDGLDLLPSGPIPPNPSELLDSPVLGRMLQAAEDAGYDHVVVDSPPLLSVADPVIIGTTVDSVILIVRAEATPRPSIHHAESRLAQAGIKPIGVVLNGARASHLTYGAYYEAPQADAVSANAEKRGRGAGTS